MTTTIDPPPDLGDVERMASARLAAADTAGGPEDTQADGDAPGDGATGTEAPEDDAPPASRIALAVCFPVLACAVMVGGMFLGVAPRVHAAVAGLLGVGLAVVASRVSRPAVAYATIVSGVVLIGLVLLVPSGASNVFRVRNLVAEAVASGDVLRPPVPFVAGWQAIVAWLLAIIGFTAAWLGIALRRPSLALLLPLPAAAIAGISVPDSAQIPSGVAVLVLFAVGLGVLSSGAASGGEGSTSSVAFEVRRAIRALPVIIVVTGVLFALGQADFLFPAPAIDPAQEPQKPKTVPLSEVEDRVLFEVSSPVSGPWRLGGLDVYDGKDWRLPPFAQNRLEQVPRSGVVDPDLDPGVTATFTIAGLTGAVLPGLPNTTGIRAAGPLLAFDDRNGNIRLVNGQIQPGLSYDVVAATLPTAEDLRAVTSSLPDDVRQYTEIPPQPPAVADLIGKAPTTSAWDTFDFLRTFVLDNVTATGAGSPVSITPDRVQDILAGSREATPFEIVATQAMLARWIGVPSRLGYGFDQGEQVGERLQVRPRHGAVFVEVYFPGYKWLPVIGTPKKAKPTSGSDTSQQRVDPNILPSDEIAVQLTLPVLGERPDVFAERVQRGLAAAAAIALVAGLAALVVPIARKAVRRSRRRSAALAAGPRARIAVAYAEFRDLATDFGTVAPVDTPLMFLRHFPQDDEHRELAWLTTRALWGDLRDDVTSELAVYAEELSRSLRRRLAAAHAPTLRAIAVVSRLSLRQPYAADLPAAASSSGSARRTPVAAGA